MKIIRVRDIQGIIYFAAEKEDGSALRIEGDIFGDYEVTEDRLEVAKLLAPVVPSVFLCAGLNYRKHAEESGAKIPDYPVLFMKLPGTVQNPGDPIVLPRYLRSDEVDYEGELAVVMAKPCKNVSRAAALDYVLGYTCANDVSARDWQIRRSGGQWCRSKSFDTFAPLGPRIVTFDEIPDPNSLQIKTLLNGEVVQDCNTNDMIFDVSALIEFLSASTTIPAGAVILTGTPHGVGFARKPQLWMKPGDRVVVEIEKIGVLSNSVVEEAAAI